MIGKDNPVRFAAYAKDNDLLKEPGWKFLQCIVRSAKNLQCMLNITCKHQKATTVQYKIGVRIPCIIKETIYVLDKENGITFWADAIKLQLAYLFDYKSFDDTKKKNYHPPGDTMIFCHMVFNCKEDSQCRACFVGGGHCTLVTWNVPSTLLGT